MLTHFARSVRDTFERLSLKKLVTTCGLNRVNTSVLKSRATSLRFGNSCHWRRYVGTHAENSDVKADHEDKFGRSQKDSWTDSIQLEHSALGLLGWSTALAIGWCMSQPFFRKCILPSEGNKRDRAAVLHSFTKTAFAQPSVGINKANSYAAYNLTKTAFAQPSSGADKTKGCRTLASSHSHENDSCDTHTTQEALEKAADDLAQAQNALAAAIDNRLGVKHMKLGKNNTAVAHFLKSVKLGNRTSMFNMGICYEMGLGVEKDLTQAVTYYRMAAEKGHPTAIYNLGVFHMYGVGGVVRDPVYAQELFKHAASLGQREAKEAYEKLSSYLEKMQRLKHPTNEPVSISRGLNMPGASSNKKPMLLQQKISSDVLHQKSKLTEVLVSAGIAQESWTQDFIKLAYYVEKPR